MVYEKEHEKQANVIFDYLNGKIPLTDKDRMVINHAVKEAYINGYNDGVTDGKDISEHPISG